MQREPFPDGAAPPADSPHLRVLAQYVKELSFRNPMAALSTRAHEAQPTIDMAVEVKSRRIGESAEAQEVDLVISVQAKRESELLFSVDLTYSGLFQFVNVHPEEIEPMIWIECPRLLFPFSRQILAEITREGGYPPLMINPIDFTPLYWAEMRDREARQAPPSAEPAVAQHSHEPPPMGMPMNDGELIQSLGGASEAAPSDGKTANPPA